MRKPKAVDIEVASDRKPGKLLDGLSLSKGVDMMRLTFGLRVQTTQVVSPDVVENVQLMDAINELRGDPSRRESFRMQMPFGVYLCRTVKLNLVMNDGSAREVECTTADTKGINVIKFKREIDGNTGVFMVGLERIDFADVSEIL